MDEAAADAVLTAGWCLAGNHDSAAGRVRAAQYRVSAVPASRAPEGTADLAAERMRGRPACHGLIRRRRAGDDRRAVLVSAAAAGRPVPGQPGTRVRDELKEQA